jgi:hypothetical protein
MVDIRKNVPQSLQGDADTISGTFRLDPLAGGIAG